MRLAILRDRVIQLLPGFIDMHAHVLFPPLDDDGRPLPRFDRETSLALLRTLLLHARNPCHYLTALRRNSGKVTPIESLTLGI